VTTREAHGRSRTRRRYESPRRERHAAETRAAIVDAARRLFGERGWAGTGMRDVARAAGVAVETVYSNFGSKAEVLLAVIDVAIVGDTLPIPLAERAEFAELGRGTLAERACAAARLVREIHERTYRIEKALREAAAADGELSKRLTEGDERRRINVEQGVHLVARRPVGDTERDGLWAVLSMEVYQLLVERSGWSASRYEDWLAETIVRVLRPGPKERP